MRYIRDVLSLAFDTMMKAFVILMRDRLVARACRTPYSHIPADASYMERYWLVPYTNSDAGCGWVSLWKRPLARLLQHLGVAVRIHVIKRGDHERAYHDHPWDFWSVILSGVYWEHRPTYDLGLFSGESAERFEAGSFIRRKAEDLHRLEVPEGQIVWTLFITFRWRQNWGFVEDPGFKVHYRQYLAEHDETKPADSGDDYNSDLSAVMDYIVNGFGATEDHQTVEAAIREAGRFREISDAEVMTIMQRIVRPEPVGPLHRTVQRPVWVMARCKECNGLTCAAKFEIPREAEAKNREFERLEKENRYPYTGIKAKDQAWCHCDAADKPEDPKP